MPNSLFLRQKMDKLYRNWLFTKSFISLHTAMSYSSSYSSSVDVVHFNSFIKGSPQDKTSSNDHKDNQNWHFSCWFYFVRPWANLDQLKGCGQCLALVFHHIKCLSLLFWIGKTVLNDSRLIRIYKPNRWSRWHIAPHILASAKAKSPPNMSDIVYRTACNASPIYLINNRGT